MSQPVDLEIVAPTGEPHADHALLAEIRGFLGREEIVNTIMLAGLLARDGFDPNQPVLAARAGDDLAAVATLTPGFLMSLSHVDRGEAIPALAAAAVERGLEIPGVMGPVAEARAFAEAWATRTGGTYRPGMAQRILTARAVTPPADVPGTWRHLEPGDRPALIAWFTAFTVEAEAIPAKDARRRGQAMFDRLDHRSGGLLWLDERGAPVSVACYKAPTMSGIRIGPVYTPPEYRRRGYAAAVTAATTQLMFDRGYAFACLYTDAANATANHVYESIGYASVAESMQYRFAGGAA